MNTKNPTKNSVFGMGLAGLCLLATVADSPAQTISPCNDTNTTKWYQPPQLFFPGLDVKDSRGNGIVLADDFPCTSTGPITGIHIWGSWAGDVPGTITNFWIGIYSDVPAVTIPASGQIVSNSHPGILLWTNNYSAIPPQFFSGIYTNGQEYFYNPANGSLGGDTMVWYYCFYPTNPFVQMGTAAAPTNYWLAIRAQLADINTNIIFGWKSSTIQNHDPAVWGTVGSSGIPLGNWQSMTNPLTQQQIDLSMWLTTSNPPTQTVPCVETNGVKSQQSPNLDGGSDVWNNGPWLLADDFVCTNSGPISDIHIWGSWLGNYAATNTLNFWLGIYDDAPVSPSNTYSHPGKLLWQQWFAPGKYAENPNGTGFELFIDPGPPQQIGTDQQAWYYCFYPTNPLIQLGSPCAPKIYWLAAYAQPPTSTTTNLYGWKSAQFVQNDVSVHAPWPGIPPTNNPGWMQTHQPPTGPPLDLAFKITTATNQSYNDNPKYIQWPNTDANGSGYDVWNSSAFPPGVTDGPWVLADDFVCTNTGYISDIHLWGSWLYDSVATNQITFWIGLFNDVPAVTNSAGAVIPSHPGSNFWSQCFPPGCYGETYWSPAVEGFLDPGPPLQIGNDYSVWYYSFMPTNPPIQWGSPISPRTYWVGAFAQLPAGTQFSFGWKTTTNLQHDISVHSHWPFSGTCPPNPNLPASLFAWIPNHSNLGPPLDLAFEISTVTNCSASFLMIDKDYVNNKVVVTWPSGFLQWSTKVDGPYVDVPGSPTSPYKESYFPLPVNPTNHFYRVRCN